MKTVLCIFYGLPRSFERTFENIQQNLLFNNSKDFVFKFLVNTECNKNELQIIKQKLNINDDNIILYNCKNKKESNHMYLTRIYQSLKKEENNLYDIYINLRFDIILSKPIDLHNYLDKHCIITGDHKRPCCFHNRDWDLMCIGNNYSYKLYMYPIINISLTKYYNENIEMLKDNSIDVNICNFDISNEDIVKINTLCGLITEEPIHFYSSIIQNLLNKKGNFIVSDNYEKHFVKIIR